jgi:hypothetical protein
MSGDEEHRLEAGNDEEDDCYKSCLDKCGGCCMSLRTWLPFPCCFIEYPFKTIN